MYEELVKRLREAARFSESRGYSGMANTAEEAADAIEELSKPRWIPVTEQLPKIRSDKIFSEEVYVTDGEGIGKSFIIRYSNGSTKWSSTSLVEITHWCEKIPLPEPPKEE